MDWSKGTRYLALLIVGGFLMTTVVSAQEGFRTNKLLLDDNATGLADRNTITLLSPSTGVLTADYQLRLPDQTNMLVGSMLFANNVTGSTDLAWLAPGTQGQVLRIDSSTGLPYWATVLELPYGTVDNSTLRWDDATGQWVENINLLSDVDGNTIVNGTIEVNGTTATINSATITTPNVPAGANNDTNVVLRDATNNLVIRSINDLIQDATLSENAIWVGDANNNPIEVAAGTQGQVLRIDSTTGAPSWKTILELPYGTTDNSTLRWDDATGQWVENVNLLSDVDGNTTVNGTIEVNGTTATINSATITTPNVPAGGVNDTNVVLRDASNNLVIRSINDLIDDATLSENAIWVGDANNNPIEVAAGTQGQVLRIDSTTGAPSWKTILELPYGTTDNSTLRWDDATSQWVENVNLLSDATGNTTINGTTITTPNIPAGADNDTNIVIRDGSDNLAVRSINQLIADATLSENAIWVGNASNNPIEVAAGTQGQVLRIDSTTGAPSWKTILELPYGTTDNSTLRWDDATGQWVENVNLLSDATGNTTINGTTITTPNIPAGVDNDTNIVIRDGSDNLAVRSINQLIADATLSENAIWVGNASNNPIEVAAGTQGQVLRIDSTTGAPSWKTILELPYGTTDNSTLRWDDATGQWVENVNLLSDATGNTTINGTTITTPNIPAGADNDTNIVIRDGSDNLAVRSINELIADATLSENAIWVGDVNNNPVERPAGTTDQVLQIAADGTPQWQDLNLIFQGREATAGTLTQTIPNTNVTATGSIQVTYEDPSNGARVSIDVIGRSAGASFDVGFSALPPAGTFINYTVSP